MRAPKVTNRFNKMHHPQILKNLHLRCNWVAGQRYWSGRVGSRRHGSVCQTWYLTQFRVLTPMFIVALFLQSNTISANHKCLNDVKSRNVVTSRRFWIWRHLGRYYFLSRYCFKTLNNRIASSHWVKSHWVGLCLGSEILTHFCLLCTYIIYHVLSVLFIAQVGL